MISKRSSGKKGVTLRDVVVHMSGMEQRLSKRIVGVETRLDGIETHMGDMESRLTERINAFYEDLTATIRGTINIRKHVGMAVPDEE